MSPLDAGEAALLLADPVRAESPDPPGDETRIGVSGIDLKPAVETPVGHPFVRAALTRTGGGPPIGVACFSDAAVLAPALGLATVILGPGTLGASGMLDESLALADVAAAADFYEALARDWLGA